VTGPSKPGVLPMSCLRQGGRSGLPENVPCPRLGLDVGLDQLLELEEKGGVLIPRQQSKKQSVSQLEWATSPWPLQLDESAILGDGANVLDALGRRRPQAQQVATPDACILLPLSYRQRGLGVQDGGLRGCDGVGRGKSRGSQLRIGSVPEGWPSVFEQPGEGYPVLVRQFQKLLPDDWGPAKRPQR